MALPDTDVPLETSGTPRRRPRFTRRTYALTAYAVAFVVYWMLVGLPTDPAVAILFMWVGTIAWGIERPWRDHLRFARDWAPIVGLLIVYDFSRGWADNLSAPHVTEMIDADVWLFGELPTLWLQEHFYDPNHVHWWDVVASWIYFSHFVASFAVAVVLWVRRRALWAAFMRRWFGLTAAGLATYFLYPAAPPWWASKYGYLTEHVERMSGRGWDAIGLGTAGKLLNVGQAMSNPVAAMPSLHSGFALCVVAFFFTRVRKRWLPLLIAYPVAMSVVLAYTGEHYMVDAFVGWTYVGVVYLLVNLAERWWRARRAAAVTAEAEATIATAERQLGVARAELVAPQEVLEPPLASRPVADASDRKR
jgi:hypothetical protein